MHLSWFLIFMLSANGVFSLKILSIVPTATKSHHLWVSSLSVALAKRGHEVNFVTFHQVEENVPTLNVSIMDQPAPEVLKVGSQMFQSMRERKTSVEQLYYFYRFYLEKCRSQFERAPLNNMIQPGYGVKFDVILLDYGLEDCLFGLIHRFDYAPTILISPFTYNPHWLLRVMSNPLFTASPHWLSLYPRPMTIWQRVSTLFVTLYDDFLYYNFHVPENDRINRKYLGEDTPSVTTLQKHVSLALINQHSTEFRAPIGANLIPVGGMHLQPSSNLSQDLQDFLDGARHGAVLMSFGSREQSDSVGAMEAEAVMAVFSRLPQRFIWKLGSPESLRNVPPNVMLRQWLPQNDVLAHPNLRLFISHCGGLSTQEAAFHGVPVLAIPFLVDQITNSETLVDRGVGRMLSPKLVNPDSFYQNIKELITNPKYGESAKRLKAILRSDVAAPMDRAIFWVEFVGTHGGVPQMRSPLQDILPHSIVLEVVIASLVVFSIVAVFLLLLGWLLKVLWTKIGTPRCQRSKQKVL